jgi:dTDP-4-dehydrorhamnose reductase
MNVTPVRDLAQAIQQQGLKTQTQVVFFSSDYVFNGERGGYRDCQPPSPTTCYGRSKAEAEQVLESSGIQHTIVRTSAVMGRGGTFFDWLVSSLTEGKKTELFEDVRFSPTSLLWLCRQTLSIAFLTDKAPRVVHLCGSQEMSRFEFGSIVATVMGVNKDIVCPTKLQSSGDLFRPNLSLVSSDGFRNDKDPADWVREELMG